MKGIKQQMREGMILPPYEGSEKLIKAINGRFTKRKPQD